MGGACSTCSGEERYIQGFGGYQLEDRRRWEDNIKRGLKKLLWEGVDWIDLVRVGDKWSAVVNAVLKLRVP